MWQFESKEVCESLCFHSKSEYTGGRKLVVWDGVCGAVAARLRRVARLILGIAFLAVILGEARQDRFSQYNADADVV